MTSAAKKRAIGVFSLVLGVSLALMLVFELKDGTLYGSKSDGMTLESHPVVFYIGTILQGFVVLLLVFSGISLIRHPE
ncbi:MAG: hypothetical protein QM785_14140 [Pyrinomonadaceae bacterium]